LADHSRQKRTTKVLVDGFEDIPSIHISDLVEGSEVYRHAQIIISPG